MNKEQIYDEEISPLMAQVIDICQKHKIAMVMTFHLPDDEQDTLHCSTALVSEDWKPSEMLLEMNRLLRIPQPLRQITLEKGNGEKTLISLAM